MLVRDELVIAVAVIQVLEPLYRASSMAWFIVLSTALALVNFRLKLPKDISPVKGTPTLSQIAPKWCDE